MKRVPVLILAIFILCSSCVHLQKGVNPEAKKLGDQAFNLVWGKPNAGEDSLKKAIVLLDQAIKLDSNFYEAYYNKFAFQTELKDYKGALLTCFEMQRLRPKMIEITAIVGAAYERAGDSISAIRYYTSALATYNKLLDTIRTKNRDYKTLMAERASTLIMLHRQAEANAIFKQLADAEIDPNSKKSYLSLMNKSRYQYLYETTAKNEVSESAHPVK
jgi:tetratricopeptide (TPR) repeat protein